MTISVGFGPPVIRLNLRRGTSTTRFADAPQFEAMDGSPITPTRAAMLINGKRALLLVHGYRVEDPAGAYAQLGRFVGQMYDVIVEGYWPGSDWMLGFWFARHRAGRAGRMIAEAMCPLMPESLDVEGHSLGCMVALEAANAGLLARNLILAAPAVDNESIQRGERYALAMMRCQRVLVAHSTRDDVLATAYRVGRWDNALGLRGPQDKTSCFANTRIVDCSATAGGHSAYKSDPTFLTAWRDIA